MGETTTNQLIATPDEIRIESEKLSETQLSKLKVYASIITNIYSEKYFTEYDLLQEAFLRTLDGRRKWKKEEIGFYKYLQGTIKSLANELKGNYPEKKVEESEKRKITKEMKAHGDSQQEIAEKLVELKYKKPVRKYNDETINDLPSQMCTPEQSSLDREELNQKQDKLKILFANDQEAQDVIYGLLEGISREEFQDVLELNDTEYYTVRRRILRKVNKGDKGEANV